MAIECVEELGPELNIDAFRNSRPLDQPKIFFVIREVPVVTLIRRFVAKTIGQARSSGHVRIGITEGRSVVPEVLARNRGIEGLVHAGCRLDRLTSDQIPADIVVPARNVGGTAKPYRLATLVPLDAGNRPSAHEVAQCAAVIQERLIRPEWQVIEIADHEDL